ncbi:acid sphingomyelinase-like phosphodiesterase 3a isoform X2 [Hylobates moloch]|uniref:acid sphingomyelinase-like phosphodiesterase 3a isoform X2 n=1 Tax=Hylobates moloch TaxID=81572 RepID=UPI002675374D|nr:acid sphingomyelinase-like phosphodiesterase 3a isoform X2 [Hylobates moloch]
MALLRALVCCLLTAWHCRCGLGLPVAPAGGRNPPPGIGQFWHVTDLHLDPTYHITDDHTKVCASSKGANASNPGPFGDVLCDSPYQLILSAFDFIKNSGQEASFMIWTGDSPPHVPVPELSTDTVINVITNMTTTIQSLFPNLQVFPALGNHDYWPQVYIIAHVPVGYLPSSQHITAVREYYNEKLIDIFRKYSDVIAGQFYGHTHRDSIMVLSDKKGSPVNSLFVAPAVTPVKSVLEKQTNNPGIRLFQYDPRDYKLLDMLQYYLNLTEANLKGESIWKLEYILTQTYDIEDLQPESLYGLAKQFAILDSKQFIKYYNYFFVSYDSSVICDKTCKAFQICAIMNLDNISYVDCLKQLYIKHNY